MKKMRLKDVVLTLILTLAMVGTALIVFPVIRPFPMPLPVLHLEPVKSEAQIRREFEALVAPEVRKLTDTSVQEDIRTSQFFRVERTLVGGMAHGVTYDVIRTDSVVSPYTGFFEVLVMEARYEKCATQEEAKKTKIPQRRGLITTTLVQRYGYIDGRWELRESDSIE